MSAAFADRACRTAPLALFVVALLLPACESDGNFTVLGYTTRPNYDPNIHTVYVPIFENRTYYRGLEFEVTQAVIREIEAKTPFKIVSCREGADTELSGTILTYTKGILNRNQLNEVREVEMLMTAEVYWKDLRTGELLSQPQARRPGELLPPLPPSSVPGLDKSAPLGTPAPPAGLMPPAGMSGDGVATGPPANAVPGTPGAPVIARPLGTPVSSTADFVPEVGGSISSAKQQNVDRLARQIVFMMEKPW